MEVLRRYGDICDKRKYIPDIKNPRQVKCRNFNGFRPMEQEDCNVTVTK